MASGRLRLQLLGFFLDLLELDLEIESGARVAN
jgi:hypothetical protein